MKATDATNSVGEGGSVQLLNKAKWHLSGMGIRTAKSPMANFCECVEIVKSIVMPESPIPGLRYFVQNHGSCGSMYIAELMQANGIGPSYHEKYPDLDELGIDYFEGKISSRHVKRWLRLTRRDVFFEASNRLFSMGKCLQELFPDAKYIHLHRDPRTYVPSGLSKPREAIWGSQRKRFQCKKLGAGAESDLASHCIYWRSYNEQILADLEGREFLSLNFQDLIAGNLQSLEAFMNTRLTVRSLQPVNARKPKRKEGQFPAFEEWNQKDQDTVHQICGPMMQRLGYL